MVKGATASVPLVDPAAAITLVHRWSIRTELMKGVTKSIGLVTRGDKVGFRIEGCLARFEGR